jgi:hypothetical protein
LLAEEEGRRAVVARTKRKEDGLGATELVEIGIDDHGADQRIRADRRRTVVGRARRDHVESTRTQLLDERKAGALQRGPGLDVAVDDEYAQR